MKKGNVILLSVLSLLALVFIVSLVSAAVDPNNPNPYSTLAASGSVPAGAGSIPGATADPNSIPGASVTPPTSPVTTSPASTTPGSSTTITYNFFGDISNSVKKALEMDTSKPGIIEQWQQGNLDASITKVIFFFLLALIFYSTLSALFGKLKTSFIIISVIVAFLATAYITPVQVLAAVQGYGAMGLTVLIAVPVVFFANLTFQAAKSGGSNAIVIQYFAWLLFLVIWLWKLVSFLFSSSPTKDYGILWILIIGVLIGLVFVVFNGPIYDWLSGLFSKAKTKIFRKKIKGAAEGIEGMNALTEDVVSGGSD